MLAVESLMVRFFFRPSFETAETSRKEAVAMFHTARCMLSNGFNTKLLSASQSMYITNMYIHIRILLYYII